MAGSLKNKSFSKECKTIILSSNPNEICDRFKKLLQEKRAGNKSDINSQEVVAIVFKLLECKCISTKQHKILLLNEKYVNK